MKLILTLTALLPFVASSPFQIHDEPQNQNLQATSHKSSKCGSQINPNTYFTPDYSSNNPNPLSSISILPWNDNDRSEILDHITTWTTCPRRYLNCKKCPHDRRCRRPGLRPSPLLDPSSSIGPISTPVYKPRPYVAFDPGEPGALTGPQLKPLPEVGQNVEESGDKNGSGVCQLSRCGKIINACGSGATCVGGYCACASGLKSSTTGTMGRGWDIPEAAIVHVDIGVACDQTCDEMFCTEVGGLEGCFMGAAGTSDGTNVVDTTNTAGHGVIQMPGTGGIDGDGPFSVNSRDVGNTRDM